MPSQARQKLDRRGDPAPPPPRQFSGAASPSAQERAQYARSPALEDVTAADAVALDPERQVGLQAEGLPGAARVGGVAIVVGAASTPRRARP